MTTQKIEATHQEIEAAAKENMEVRQLISDVLALKLINQHSTFDVTADDVFDYLHELSEGQVGSVHGFKDWLNEDR